MGRRLAAGVCERVGWAVAAPYSVRQGRECLPARHNTKSWGCTAVRGSAITASSGLTARSFCVHCRGGAMGVRFPGESAEYRAARNQLLEREVELRRAMEDVAAARRRLPPGGVVPEEYVF